MVGDFSFYLLGVGGWVKRALGSLGLVRSARVVGFFGICFRCRCGVSVLFLSVAGSFLS